MVKKLIMMALVGLIMLTHETSALVADLFNSDSDFMRGFETGLFLRTKGGTVEEYNCRVPDDANPDVRKALDLVKTSINTAIGALPDDPIITEAISMLMEFLDGLYYMFNTLSN